MKVLKFGAIWCKECLIMKPMWGEIEAEIKGFETEYFEADDSEDMLKKYNVSDIPTFVFLDKNGEEITRFVGVKGKDELVELVKENLDK